MRVKQVIISVILAVVSAAVCPGAHSQTEKPYTVVIDPGHGGKDTGCIGKLTNEKTIVLDVATRLGKILGDKHPEVNTIYTRRDDRFIELNERAAIANRANANLFISIHVNSVDKRTKGREKIHGASVYTLGLHRSDDNLEVAMRENSVIELEDDFSANYQGFDPNSTESYIIFELSQNLHMRQSIDFADAVQRELVSTASRADKGVRQSGFLVLRNTSMPAVLVELDFICNPEAEQFLASEDGREKCARSIADAFTTYYSRNRPVETATAKTVDTDKDEKIYYSIQILSCDGQLKNDAPELKGYNDATSYEYQNRYNYIVGSFDSLKDAKKRLHDIRKDFADAFIVKMKGNKRYFSNSAES